MTRPLYDSGRTYTAADVDAALPPTPEACTRALSRRYFRRAVFFVIVTALVLVALVQEYQPPPLAPPVATAPEYTAATYAADYQTQLARCQAQTAALTGGNAMHPLWLDVCMSAWRQRGMDR